MKRAVIMGGSSGIGKALAELLLSEGHQVLISGIQSDDLSAICAQYPGKAIVHYIDCSKEDFTTELELKIRDSGGMDLFVFSSGVGHLNKDIGYKVENPANKVNVLGFTEAVDWAYRYFISKKEGHLVAITSMAGLFGFRSSPAYTAAKGYQLNYMEALIQKANRCGMPVYVTDIRPGFVDTRISKELKRFWVASPQKAARQIVSAINARRKVAYVSRRWRLMATAINLVPLFIRRKL